jgi:Na+/proline symporter
MVSLALTVLEITAISVPLIAILVVQILRTDVINERVPDELLEYVSRLLVATSLLFVAAIVAAMSLALESGLSLLGLGSVTSLGLGLALLSIVALFFPLVSLSLFRDETEQQTLSETTGGTTDVEEDLPSQRKEESNEETSEPETET